MPEPVVELDGDKALVEEHERAFTLNGISVPASGDYLGPEFQDAFRETIDVVAEWIREEG